MKKFFKENYIIIGALVITVISWFIRMAGLELINGDFTSALNVWFEAFKNNGGFKFLSHDVGVYNVPYLTIIAALTYIPVRSLISIKFVSIIFDYMLGIAVGFLCYEILDENNKYRKLLSYVAYAVTVLLPTVFLNSAYWAQCDSMYAFCIVISLIFLIRNKYFWSFVFLGISFAFKLQFIFIVPLYIAIYLGRRKFPIYYFAIILLVNIIMCMPAIIAGRSFLDCMSIYLRQTSLNSFNNFEYISMNFPGFYNLILQIPEKTDNLIINTNFAISKIMVFVTMAIFACSFVYVWIKKIDFDKNLILEYGIWAVLTATFFLPYMHERYMYVAEILSIIYAISLKKWKILVPISLNLCSIVTYMLCLYGVKIVPIQLVTVLNLGVLIYISYNLIKSLKDKPKVLQEKN